MTEQEARQWIVDRFGVSRETLLDRFDAILRDEATRQNLISSGSFDQLWARHFVDSAQLIDAAAGAGEGVWLDVGTGAGMPGLVVAALIDRPVVLVEPRAKRADFLYRAAALLGIGDRVEVQPRRIESYRPAKPAAIVSARAVAELSQLIASTHHCTDSSTIWLLPKGRAAKSEVEAAAAKWQGSFHVEPSITQADSGIVIAQGVRPR
ncbi:16S rRNA (guanine(527)-N(7))-methyltransferase RsmG [Sphingomonas soli]|uniref:16S rRNA (guanine(527)-N(7))-methyltransferase RsmG n=1 Tax=Sphingomonas soli TaxID=266127 RepID=UPI00082A0839|nr:RsmG family class I SAM-dependent methyltransferase [Sphingomonas soli]